MRLTVVHPTRTGLWQVSRWTPRKHALESRRYRVWWMKRGRLLAMLNPDWWKETDGEIVHNLDGTLE
jgi:hypothetical protein